MDRHAHTHFHLPAPLDRVTVDALQEFNAIGRRIMWREPIDALRPGFRLVWDGVDPTEERRIYRWLRLRYEVIAKLREARAYTRGTGGAAIVIISMDGAPPDEPLDLANLQTVHRLVVRDRFEIWPDPQIVRSAAMATAGRKARSATATSQPGKAPAAAKAIRPDAQSASSAISGLPTSAGPPVQTGDAVRRNPAMAAAAKPKIIS